LNGLDIDERFTLPESWEGGGNSACMKWLGQRTSVWREWIQRHEEDNHAKRKRGDQNLSASLTVARSGLLQRADANLGNAFEGLGEAVDVGCDVGLTVVVGVEDRGAQGLDGLHSLLYRHGVGLVDGEECDVNIAQGAHFGGGLGVAGNVDARAAVRDDVAAVAALAGVELQLVLRSVVGGHGLHTDARERLCRSPGRHRGAEIPQGFGGCRVAEDRRRVPAQEVDGLAVEVVVVVVGHQNKIGLGKRRIVGEVADGIDVDVPAVLGLEGDRSVAEECDF